MDFSVLLVGETLSAAPLGFARTKLCNPCASRLTSQHIEFIELIERFTLPSLGMNCRKGKNLPIRRREHIGPKQKAGAVAGAGLVSNCR